MHSNGSKYGNKRIQVDGFNFDSLKEANRYGELKLLQMAGEIRELEIHPKFPIIINGQKICNYISDFRYFPKGSYHAIIEDVKSDITKKIKTYRLKKKLVEAIYNIKITEC